MDQVVFSPADVAITSGQNDTRDNAVTRKMQGEGAAWAPGVGRGDCGLKVAPAGPLGDGFVLGEWDGLPP